MKHLGDITKISGHEAPTVDCVIGGSPCQGLSNAGKRLGLKDERSGLYMEQIRIIKEMREHDRLSGRTGVAIRPRYMVWENVPGAFSSNGGKDFAAVLEEAIRIAEPEAPDVPVPPKGWPTSGCIHSMDGRWSVAWRVLDAQFWGVPQRRRRIALVADFGGGSASEILFVREGVRGHLEESKPQRKEAAGDVGASTCVHHRDGKRAVGIGMYNQAVTGDKSPTLRAEMHGNVPMIMEPFCKSARPKFADDATVWKSCKIANTLNTFDLGETRVNELVVTAMADSGIYEAATARSLDAANCGYPACNQGGMAIVQPMQTYQKVTGPLMANSHPGSYTGQDAFSDMLVAGADIRNATETPESVGPLQAAMNHNLNSNGVIRTGYIVRRLTPREAELLQGFPAGWTDIGEWVDSKGKKHKDADSPRYKALGNSIAIPPWKWVLKRICGCYERDATMASLFDGIGGFPYIWEQFNGKGSCLWASEIEEFPMAVTKMRFGE